MSSQMIELSKENRDEGLMQDENVGLCYVCITLIVR